MTRRHEIDEDRMIRLEAWLQSRGIDVLRVGDDLTLASPFKERDKRRFDSSYVDHKKRLSVRIIQDVGGPRILWKCWYASASAASGSYGGKSAFALSVRTRATQAEIYQLLDITPSAESVPTEDLGTKLSEMMTKKPEVFEQRRSNMKLNAVQQPSDAVSCFSESNFSQQADQMILQRGVFRDIAKRYGLRYGLSSLNIVFPIYDPFGNLVYYLTWNGSRYHFPRDLGEDYFSKEDVIFGLHLWTPKKPMILSEGVFDALSLIGQAVLGSALSDHQFDLVKAAQPPRLILANDNDRAGKMGSKRMESVFKHSLPETRIIVVNPPSNLKDWNELAQKVGPDEVIRVFCQRVQQVSGGESFASTVSQIIQ